MSGVVTIQSILDEFKSAHYVASNVYVDPVVSVPHVLQYMFPLLPKKILKDAATQLISEGMWASSLVRDFILEEKPPFRRRFIRNTYQPAKILHAEIVESTSKLNVTVPVVRLYGHWQQRGYDYWGQLFFRCPICGDIHHYSAREKFGEGDREKQGKCNESGVELYHSIREVRDISLVGHLPKKYMKVLAIPD